MNHRNIREDPRSRDSQAGLSFTEDEAHIVQPVISFIRSASYEEKHKLIITHPELLTQKADEIMARIVELHRKHGSERDAEGTQTWREFLADARRKNFDYALARSRINRIFVELPDSPTDWNSYLRSVAHREDALRNKDGDIALAEFAKKLRDDDLPAPAAAFEGLRFLIKQSSPKVTK